MLFDEILDQVRELLRSRGRLSYRALKRRFELDDEYLEDIKEELIKAERVATDEEGAVLVWTGEGIQGESENRRIGESENQQPPQTLDTRRPTLDSSRPEAERRQLTVMFCDLVGSTT